MEKQYGLIAVQNNDDLAASEAQERAERERLEANRVGVESSLSAHVRRQWERAVQAKNQVELRMLRNLRQRNGEYDPDKLAAIKKQGGSEIFMMLTAIKCRAAKSWIRDILSPPGDKPWSLKPSTEPEISPEVEQQIQVRLQQDAMQFAQQSGQQVTPAMMEQVGKQVRDRIRDRMRNMAEEAASRMEKKIEDQLNAGGWTSELDAAVSDFVDQGTCILKAPVLQKDKQLAWMADENGRTRPQAREEIKPCTRWVDAFNFYPAPGITDPQDGDCIERHQLSRAKLYSMIGVPGFNEDEIRAALREYRDGGLNDWLTWTVDDSRDRANRIDTTTLYESDEIDALEYWGSVQGSLLHEWGVGHDEAPDAEAEYQAHVWLIGRHVIRAELNPDPLDEKPYGKACFQEMTGSFWGQGVPELIRDCQQICNAAARAVVNNMGIASGPQVVVNLKSLAPGESATDVFPWRVWQVDYSEMGNSQKMPVEFYQPNPMTEALMSVYDRFSREAEEQSGVPSYTHGSTDVSGAGRTASGLSMLMNAASKAIKNAVSHLDTGIIEPTVRRYYVFNMLHDKDESIKGDLKPVARGAMSLVAKEQTQMRRQEFLESTANPIDSEITGIKGRAAVLREVAKGLDMVVDDVVPDDETLEAQIQQKLAQQAEEKRLEANGGQPPAKRAREADAAGRPMGETA